MKRRRRVPVALFAATALSTTAIAADRASRSVSVSGTVAEPTTHTVASLASLPQHDVVMTSPDGTSRRHRGPLLRDVVGAARPREAGRFDLRQGIVIAHATDGYLAIFSWAELFNGAIGDRVLVAIARDDGAIDVRRVMPGPP